MSKSVSKILAKLIDKDDDDVDEDAEEFQPIKKAQPVSLLSADRPKSGLLSMLPPPKSAITINPFIKKQDEKNEEKISQVITTSSTSKTKFVKTIYTSSSSSANSNSERTVVANKPLASNIFVPQSVFTKPAVQQMKSAEPMAPKEPKVKLLVGYGSDDEDDDASDQEEEKKVTDNFFLKEDAALAENPRIEALQSDEESQDDEDYDHEEEDNYNSKRFKKDALLPSTSNNQYEEEDDNNDEEPMYNVDDDPEPQFEQLPQDQRIVDQQALEKLCGAGKKKRNVNDIVFTDVRVNDIVGDNKTELMKQITSEYRPPSNKEYFTNSSRKAHHITNLAKVAKERNMELEAMWANERFSKRQARQKYGF